MEDGIWNNLVDFSNHPPTNNFFASREFFKIISNTFICHFVVRSDTSPARKRTLFVVFFLEEFYILLIIKILHAVAWYWITFWQKYSIPFRDTTYGQGY